ncbi:MAG: YbaY family lipoprotein, partial [Pyrinomonadaceae bacterium]
MHKKLITLLFTMAIAAATAFGQTSWLDRPLNINWNNGNGVIPSAPRTLVAIDTRCRDQIRVPDSLADRAVTRAGWSLFGAAQNYGPVTIINAMASVDGMCRPTQFNTFVFVANRFAGTLSPVMMNSRTDGSLIRATLNSPTAITANFNRYASRDPLCCPSQASTVNYSISTGTRPFVKAEEVETEAACPTDGIVETQDNVVSGTVTYSQRTTLPATATLVIKLVDVSRADVSSTTIAEQRITTGGKQVPFAFDMAYDRKNIEERNRYAIQAEIRDAGKLLFITETSYPVLTQGNPRVVDVVVVPVGVVGTPGNRSGLIRGSITYYQRIALGTNSEVTLRVVDAATPTGTPVAESKTPTNGKQVPLSFELQFDPRDINRQRNYELEAEIRTDGKLQFKTERGQPITFRGNQADVGELVLVPARDEPVAITGKSISLSKFGTGTLQVAGGSSLFLINGSVAVRADGAAEVSVSGIT